MCLWRFNEFWSKIHQKPQRIDVGRASISNDFNDSNTLCIHTPTLILVIRKNKANQQGNTLFIIRVHFIYIIFFLFQWVCMQTSFYSIFIFWKMWFIRNEQQIKMREKSTKSKFFFGKIISKRDIQLVYGYISCAIVISKKYRLVLNTNKCPNESLPCRCTIKSVNVWFFVWKYRSDYWLS